jgi:uncharacterized membrane protein
MRHRMAAAVLALGGLLLSVFLLLHQLGLGGSLACGGSGACERVQASPYAWLFGLPVAAYGVGGYAAILAVALAGLQPRWAGSRAPTRLLVLLSAGGVLFTAYLKWLELFRIHAICRWCVGSAVLIVAILAVAVWGVRSEERLSDRDE